VFKGFRAYVAKRRSGWRVQKPKDSDNDDNDKGKTPRHLDDQHS